VTTVKQGEGFLLREDGGRKCSKVLVDLGAFSLVSCVLSSFFPANPLPARCWDTVLAGGGVADARIYHCELNVKMPHKNRPSSEHKN